MVLTEGFAAGTPVVASDIAGYRDVVRDGVDGLLVPARRRHGAGRDAARPRARAASAPHALGAAAGAQRRALRLAEGRRAGRRRLRGRARRAAAASAPPSAPPCGSACAPPTSGRAVPRGGCRRSSRRRRAARRAGALLRRGAIGARGARRRPAARTSRSSGSALDRVAHTLVTSSPTWVLVGLALMCVSMVFRAVSWHAILKRGAARRRARASPTPGRARPSAC